MFPKMPSVAAPPLVANAKKDHAQKDRILWLLGMIAIAIALAASWVLVFKHMTGVQLWGCGPRRDCDALTSGGWGRLGGISVSLWGAAYFTAAAAAWMLTLIHGLSPLLRNFLRGGILASLGFVGLMIFLKKLCVYCAVVHAANLLLFVCAELRSRTHWVEERLQSALFVFTFCAMGALGWGMEYWKGTAELAKTDASTDASLEALGQAARTQAQVSNAEPVQAENDSVGASGLFSETEPSQESQAPSEPSTDENSLPSQEQSPSEDRANGPSQNRLVFEEEPAHAAAKKREGFTGRYLIGPEKAIMRIVIFSDYECPACQRFDPLALAFARKHPEVSLSIKHLPLCLDCNDYIPITTHENACQAARVAEAAGILGGDAAFWQVHEWLLDHKGQVTTEDMRNLALTFNLGKGDEFLKLVQSDEVLRNIQSDVRQAAELGMGSLPLMYMNGVEFPTWSDGRVVLEKALAKLKEEGAVAASAVVDHPISGESKYFNTYLTGEEVRTAKFSIGSARWKLGQDDARVKIAYIADHQSPMAPSYTDSVMSVFKQHPQDVQIAFFHYPLSLAKNPAAALSKERFPQTWTMALAAEAAGILGGNDAFWQMHQWLIDHQEGFKAGMLNKACDELNIPAQKLLQTMKSSDTEGAVRRDLVPSKKASVSWAPAIFVNGRELDGVATSPGLLERVVTHLLQNSGEDTK